MERHTGCHRDVGRVGGGVGEFTHNTTQMHSVAEAWVVMCNSPDKRALLLILKSVCLCVWLCVCVCV
jgi:hypothetical protein